jgi:methyl-accepting chemotaxis protein
MLKNVKVGAKLVGGFIIVALLVVLVGVVGMYGLQLQNDHIDEIGMVRLPSIESLLFMSDEIENIRGSVRTLLSPRISQEDRTRMYSNIDAARASYGEAKAVYEPLPQTPEEARLWREMLPVLEELAALNDQVIEVSKVIDQTDILNPDAYEARIAGFISDHHILMENMLLQMVTGREFSGGDDPTACRFGQYLAQVDTTNPLIQRVLTEVVQYHDTFHQSVADIRNALQQGDQNGAVTIFNTRMQPNAERVFEYFDELLAEAQRVVAFYDQMGELAMVEAAAVQRTFFSLLDDIIHINEVIAGEAVEQAVADSARVSVITIAGMAIAAILALLLGLALTRAITKPLALGVDFAKAISLGDLGIELDVHQKDEVGQLAEAMREMQEALQQKARVLERIAEGDLSVAVKKASDKDGLGESMVRMKSSLNELISQVNTAVEQVSSGADQVSQASQSLSQGATEQASSLEEVSSSATEVNSQAKQNAENATEANTLAKKAAGDANSGNQQMADLVEAMKKINASSDEINKVVKVIDDIAFQINLLALNANVEAARAGKYGKGFAVVAEEVRNLAVRAANAVKETSNMVEESISNIKRGNEFVDLTATQLASIVEGAGKVANFLEEIATASREQAQAIDQISEGLDQIDQVTQSNTASAEESASASEELAGQSQQLQGLVRRFILDEKYVSGSMGGMAASGRALPEPAGYGYQQQQSRQKERPAPGKQGLSQSGRSHSRDQETGITPVNPEDVIKLDDDDFDRF